MTNRLAASTSPYLLQHADNPVHWQEWGPEAFAAARQRNVPVLLSVGYAACHWCHVMAHESFEDEATAAAMNELFVCVKVDREERPDVDALYMEATQAMTGHGGWPMTVFLTPDAEPVYCGTYFPPEPRHGMPSFGMILDAVATAWRERPAEVREAGARVREQLARPRSYGVAAPVSTASLDRAAAGLAGSYDEQAGGFERGGPKFPPSMVLEFLLRHHARTQDAGSLRMVEHTCERMARGGVYDQLAGGFARYSVDGEWVVPHFEKMLYDNALLLSVYLHLWRETGSELARRVTTQTADFLLADLGTVEGGFASALDADTDGAEGLTYVWTPAELGEVLGRADGEYAATLYGVTAEGTFEHGRSVLQLPGDPDDPGRAEGVRDRLLTARAARPQPGRDDKVVTGWNGLAIGALAEAAALLGRPDWLAAAARAADLLLRVHLVDGRLRRTSRDGVAGRHPAVLEDYADLAQGLLGLSQVTADGRWLLAAEQLLAVIVDQFAAPDGGLFDTARDAEALLLRPRDPTDGPVPAGAAAAAGALLGYAALSASASHRTRAEEVLATYAGLLDRAPRAAGWAAAVGEALVAGPLEVAVVGPDREALLAIARRATSPGAVVVAGEADGGAPLLAGRAAVSGRATAYVCQGFVCDRPLTDPVELAGRLRSRFAQGERPRPAATM